MISCTHASIGSNMISLLPPPDTSKPNHSFEDLMVGPNRGEWEPGGKNRADDKVFYINILIAYMFYKDKTIF
jgi:hypothetical protein